MLLLPQAVVVKADADVDVTGLEASGQVNGVVVWITVVPNQTPSYNEVVPSQSPTWTEVEPEQTPNWRRAA